MLNDQFRMYDENMLGNQGQQEQQVGNNYQQQPQEQQPQNYRNDMLDYSMGQVPEHVQQRLAGQQQPNPSQQQQQPVQNQQPRQYVPMAMAPANRPIPRGLKVGDYLKFKSSNDTAQAKVDNKNAPYVQLLKKNFDRSEKAIQYLDSWNALYNTGKVASGSYGRFAPEAALSEESRKAQSIGTQLAALKAAEFGGVMTKAKIDFAERLKLQLGQTKAQQKFVEDILRKDALVDIRKHGIYEQILKENGNFEIPNILSEVNRRYKQQFGNTLKDTTDSEAQQYNREYDALGKEGEQNPDTNLAAKGVRNAAGITKSVGAGVAGIPGDAISTGFGAANWLTRPYEQGNQPQSLGEKLDKFGAPKEKIANFGTVPTYEEIQDKYLPISLPTSAQTNEFIDKLTGGYTAPKNEVEQALQNVGTFVGSLVGGALKGPAVSALSKVLSPAKAATAANLVLPFSGVPWKKSLAIASASETAGQVASKLFGLGTEAQIAARIAAGSVVAGYGTAGIIEEGVSDVYNIAREEGKVIETSIAPIEQDLKNYSNSIPKNAGYKANATKLIDETLETLKQFGPEAESQKAVYPGKTPIKKPTGGKISASNLVEAKQASNEWHTLAEESRHPGGPHLPRGARKYADGITRILNKHIEPLALKNPAFGKPLTLADDMFKAKKAANWLKNWVKDQASPTGSNFFDPIKMILGVAGNYTAGEAAAIYNHIFHQPATRHFYFKALKAAAQGNTTAYARALSDLNKEMDKKK
jgi:hypothetical protein